jgi:hypothetical protein
LSLNAYPESRFAVMQVTWLEIEEKNNHGHQ